MPEPVVLILGCGAGGVTAAREARRLLPASHRVIVIDRDADASFPPSYPWVVTGERRPESIRRHRAQLARRGIEFVNADVRQIDVANRYVRAESREFRYDYLILALGAQPAMEAIPGLAETAHGLHTLETAERLAATLRYFSGGRVMLAVTGLPFKGPSVPYETAMLLEHHFHSRRMRQKVEIAVYTPEALPLEFLGSENGEAITGLLAHKGIEFHAETTLVSVDPVRREASFAGGALSPFQLLIAVPQLRSPAILREAGLVDETGWVSVSPRSMETAIEDVFAVGDLTYLRLPNGLPLPKAGIFAERQAQTAARHIAFRIKGGAPPPPFETDGRMLIEVGAGAAAVVEGDFSSPQPLALKQPSIVWHMAKLALERYWLWRTY
ncbi:MAG: NAD(P)/FAD-dependent oxidoreductase [Dehalococcoidia bacterium]|nr:NAD(P)/FAD-dependent oxidoreductase [Dehalococcoidia bacterium]